MPDFCNKENRAILRGLNSKIWIIFILYEIWMQQKETCKLRTFFGFKMLGMVEKKRKRARGKQTKAEIKQRALKNLSWIKKNINNYNALIKWHLRNNNSYFFHSLLEASFRIGFAPRSDAAFIYRRNDLSVDAIRCLTTSIDLYSIY